MAQQTLDTNETGSYTGDGGTSNNAKANANFTELYEQSFVSPVYADVNGNLVTPIVSATVAASATLSLRFRASREPTSALGDITLAITDGADDSVVVAAVSIDGDNNKILTISGAGDFAEGLFCEIQCSNPDAVIPTWMCVEGAYTRA